MHVVRYPDQQQILILIFFRFKNLANVKKDGSVSLAECSVDKAGKLCGFVSVYEREMGGGVLKKYV